MPLVEIYHLGGEQAWVGDEVLRGGVQRAEVEWRARPDDPFPCFAPHWGDGVRSQACECGWKSSAGAERLGSWAGSLS